MSKNKGNNLSWDDFIKLGNPENAPDIEEENVEKLNWNTLTARVHIEKKGRGGKVASIVRDLKISPDRMKILAKELKAKCGVGGAVKGNEIIIQGDKRDKIIEHLQSLGIKDIKKSGG